MTETYAFQAEINQLLSLIINTFYSNKDIFLRELISNANDALDKIRYQSLTDGSSNAGELRVRISTDAERNQLIIEDSGIGMTRDELIRNLGTIAHSGTRGFIESIKAAGAGANSPESLIGQFGVGFYSAFLVADSVKVVSRAHGSDEVWFWESNAGGTFTVDSCDSAAFERGTQVILTIKEDQKEYLEEQKLRDIVAKHSQYIGFPIYLQTTQTRAVEEEDTEAADEAREADDEAPKTITETVWDLLNKQVPIWTRKPEDVTKEEYATFYKSTYGDWEDPLAIKHFSAEGQVEFKALLYIPPRAPFDMFTGGVNKKFNNVKLYVRKVLIMEESNEILPEYLSFIKGIVDSDDLPLNVSREMLQKNNIMKVIQKSLVKKCIDLLTELATDDEDKWKKFYAAFSKNLKLGVMEDAKSREKLKELLRFQTSKGSEDDAISLKDYVARMKEDQKTIYYVTAESFAIANNLPCIEALRKKGYEVIFMVDPIDEYLAPHLTEYDGKTLVNCSRDGFTLGGDGETNKEEWVDTCKVIQELLQDKIKEVKVSERLVKRPCVVVSDQYGWTANMERIMKAQALRSGNDAFSYMSTMKKTMEINPEHAIIKLLRDRIANDIGGTEGPVKGIVDTLYETAMVDSGYSMEDPAKYCSKIYRLIELGLGGSGDDGEAEVAAAEDEGLTDPVSSLEEVD